ncbi:hypothetical protein CDAR_613361 [Caerostris darwini]|uniref:Uncharacterized protein n=1 Tax=Caerostris darwini TaxID=1538125 RepID=A0AAV4NNR5_9ARAC|nr:hypothetical protein CDAR_613361 [Caerostris darwini]
MGLQIMHLLAMAPLKPFILLLLALNSSHIVIGISSIELAAITCPSLQTDPDLRALILRRNSLHRKFSRTCDIKDKVELNLLNAIIKQSYVNLKKKTWKDLWGSIDARIPNSKLWHLAQSLSCNQPQNVTCNIVLAPDGAASQDDKTAVKLLGEFYKKYE